MACRSIEANAQPVRRVMGCSCRLPGVQAVTSESEPRRKHGFSEAWQHLSPGCCDPGTERNLKILASALNKKNMYKMQRL